MTQIKRSFCVFICVLFTAVFFTTKASAITVDGRMSNLEWNDSTTEIIFSSISDTNCDIDFALMKYFIDEKTQAVFLAFQVTQKTAGSLRPGNTQVGVKLRIKSGTNITSRITGPDEFDPTAYSVDKGIVIGTNNDFVIEMRIGYLFGVPENPLLGLQLIDSYGDFSNYYSFPAVETSASTTATVTAPQVLYKIKFDSNGGTGGKTQSLPNGAKPVPPTVKRAGYTFTGWFPPVKNVTGATTYKAQWTKIAAVSQSTAQSTAAPKTNGSVSVSVREPDYSATTTPVEGATVENGGSPQSTAGENDTKILDGSTADNPAGDNSAQNGTGSIGIKKQIAAIAAAGILIALAIFFVIKAAKTKPPAAGKPALPLAPDGDEDDDF